VLGVQERALDRDVVVDHTCAREQNELDEVDPVGPSEALADLAHRPSNALEVGQVEAVAGAPLRASFELRRGQSAAAGLDLDRDECVFVEH
jgi:hypothetical protein